jgi:hypothetical protein
VLLGGESGDFVFGQLLVFVSSFKTQNVGSSNKSARSALHGRSWWRPGTVTIGSFDPSIFVTGTTRNCSRRLSCLVNSGYEYLFGHPIVTDTAGKCGIRTGKCGRRIGRMLLCRAEHHGVCSDSVDRRIPPFRNYGPFGHIVTGTTGEVWPTDGKVLSSDRSTCSCAVLHTILFVRTRSIGAFRPSPLLRSVWSHRDRND